MKKQPNTRKNEDDNFFALLFKIPKFVTCEIKSSVKSIYTNMVCKLFFLRIFNEFSMCLTSRACLIFKFSDLVDVRSEFENIFHILGPCSAEHNIKFSKIDDGRALPLTRSTWCQNMDRKWINIALYIYTHRK